MNTLPRYIFSNRNRHQFHYIFRTTKSSNIIKNYEELNLFLFIYRNRIGGKDTRFKDLQAFTQKSDVYISNFIKTSIQNGSIMVINSETDKRQKLYVLTEKAKETISSFSFNATFDDKLE